MKLGSKTPRPQRKRVPVPVELRTRLRVLANTMGRGKAARALRVAWDYFDELIAEHGVATVQTIAGVSARLDAVERERAS